MSKPDSVHPKRIDGNLSSRDSLVTTLPDLQGVPSTSVLRKRLSLSYHSEVTPRRIARFTSDSNARNQNFVSVALSNC